MSYLENNSIDQIQDLIETMIGLHDRGVPYCMPEEQDEETGEWTDPSGHWTGTIDEVKAHLGRDLTDREVTALSVTRDFGPMPELSEEARDWCEKQLFPYGNGRGAWWSWLDAADRLSTRLRELGEIRI